MTQSSTRGEKASHVRLSLGDVGLMGPFIGAHDVIDNIRVDVIVALLVVDLDGKLVVLVDLEHVGGKTTSLGNAEVLLVELFSVLPFSCGSSNTLELTEEVPITRNVVKSHL